MRYYVGGVNGAGKSAFLNKLLTERPDWNIVHSSISLMEYLSISGNYQALRAMPRTEVNDYFATFISELLQRSDGATDLVVDAHFLNLVHGKTYETISGDWISKFGAMVLITATADEILRRIDLDSGTRDRSLFNMGLSEQERYQVLNQYLVATRLYCERLASRYKIPLIVLTNTDGQLDKTVTNFLSADRQLRQV